MKILILASSRYAPTYNEKLKKQVAYINAFDNIEAELYNDLPLYEIEKKLLTHTYDCVLPYVVFDYTHEEQFPFAFNTALYQILLYHNQEFIGSDLYTQMLLNDKALTSQRSGMGLSNIIITRVLWENERETAYNMLLSSRIKWPSIIKPNTLSASLGISSESIVFSPKEAELVIDKQFLEFRGLSEILVEEYLQNAREYTVSVTGNGLNVITCATAMVPKNGNYTIYSFQSKNLPAEERPLTYCSVEDIQLKRRLEDCAKELASKFQLRDYCRFDFLVYENIIYLIDANTIPSLGFNYMYEYTSNGMIRLEQLLALLLYVFSKRTKISLPQALVDALPIQFRMQIDD